VLDTVSIQALSQIEIFQSTRVENIRNRIEDFKWRRYDSNEQIISHNEKSKDVYFVCSGFVRATIYTRAGKEVAFQDLGPGQMFGELSAIDGRPRATHVVALTDSTIACLTDDCFWALLERHPEIAAATLRRLSGLVRRLCDRVLEFSTLGIQNRIQAELLRLARDHSDGDNSAVIAPVPTHYEIATRVSTHREAVSRELNRLAKIGLVERQRGRLVIKNIAQLSRMVEDVLDA